MINYGDKEDNVSRWGRALHVISIKMILLLTLPCTVSLSFAAETVEGDWLVEHLIAEPAILNPVTATDFYKGVINKTVYQSLLERENRTLQLVPCLAESWVISPDRLSYLFTLREGVRWHDGVPLTSDDVVFTYESLMDPSVDAPHLRTCIRDLSEVIALDDRSFDAVLMGWSLPVEADPFQVWHSSQTAKGSNFVGFINRETHLIIEEARVTFEKEKRVQLHKDFHRIVHEEQPYTFLFVHEDLIAVDKRFQNVRVFPLGLKPAEWWVDEKRQLYR